MKNISTEDLKKLFSKHGLPFEDNWPFVSHLKVIFSIGQRANSPLPIHNKIKEDLKVIREASRALLPLVQVLQSMHVSGKVILAGNNHDPRVVEENFERLERLRSLLEAHSEDFRWLAEQAQKAMQEMPPGKKGRPKAVMREEFILNLACLWKELKGEKPKVYFDPYKETYDTPFFWFAKDACKLSGLEYQDETLGVAIKKVLKAIK